MTTKPTAKPPAAAPTKVELLIWWTTHHEAERIGSEAQATLPEYVRAQYALRYAAHPKPGLPKALWVDQKFGQREVSNWPDTFIARMTSQGTSAGVVFSSADLRSFRGVPGIVTDFQLRMVIP